MSYYYRRRGLVGPAVLITLGTLFLADRWWPGMSFHRLWPVLLIVIGVVKLLEMGMSSDDTVYPAPPHPGAPGAPSPPNPEGSGRPPVGGSQ